MNDNAAIHLRPSSIGELLDQAIAIYRRNFVAFVGIFAVVMVPLILGQLLFGLIAVGGLSAQWQDPNMMTDNPADLFTAGYFVGVMGSSALGVIQVILVQGLATAAITRALGDVYLGRPITIRDAYRRVGSNWLNLLGGLLLAAVLGFILSLWTLVPCVGWLTGPGMLAFLGMAVIPLLAPAIILERQSVTQAFHRVWDLTRRRFWPVVAYVFILTLFAQIVITGPAAVIQVIFQFIFNNPFDAMLGLVNPSALALQTIVEALTTLIATLIFLPLQTSCIILLYFDLRIRTEGFDLAVKFRQRQDGDIDALFAEPPRPARPFDVVQEEWVYFSSLSLAAVLLVGLVFTVVFTLALILAGLSI
jgi:hypothetical protein